MSDVEIDVLDAWALASTAQGCYAGQAHAEQRAAALLISTAWMLLSGRMDVDQKDVDSGIRRCEQDLRTCPCKLVAETPPVDHELGRIIGMEYLTPAWAKAMDRKER